MEIEVHGHLSRLIGGDLFPQRSYQLESYVAEGMTAFDCPGLAIGIVAGDKLVYGKGFGVRKKGGEPVDTRTVFQISSVTKGFLATTLAIAVDRGKFRWELWP
jgi:CubicO group peptidase (beta-lactamase class C family)